MKPPLVYLASPYTAIGETDWIKKQAIETKRYVQVVNAAAYFMDKGHPLFCPIAHTHPMVVHSDRLRDKTGSWWLNKDYAILEKCDQLWVYMIDGWKESFGVTQEIQFAQNHGIPVFYVEPLSDEELNSHYKDGKNCSTLNTKSTSIYQDMQGTTQY